MTETERSVSVTQTFAWPNIIHSVWPQLSREQQTHKLHIKEGEKGEDIYFWTLWQTGHFFCISLFLELTLAWQKEERGRKWISPARDGKRKCSLPFLGPSMHIQEGKFLGKKILSRFWRPLFLFLPSFLFSFLA